MPVQPLSPPTPAHSPSFFLSTPSTGLRITVFDSEGPASVSALGCGAEQRLMGFDLTVHLGTTVNCAGDASLTC